MESKTDVEMEKMEIETETEAETGTEKARENRENQEAWYVIQVTTGQEETVRNWILKTMQMDIVSECFIPLRERKIKCQGTWKLIRERLFPGYVFVVTAKPEKLLRILKVTSQFTRLLGTTAIGFLPLSRNEIAFLRHFGDANHVSGLSQVTIEEGNQVRIVSGTLLGYEGQIKKINLHKRIAIVQIEWMGQYVDLYLGIEILDKIEK